MQLRVPLDSVVSFQNKGRWLELETLWARFARLLASLAFSLRSLFLAALEPEPKVRTDDDTHPIKALRADTS